MLTWSQGAAGPPASGRPMAEHLGAATLALPIADRDGGADRTVPTLAHDVDRRLCAMLGIRPWAPLLPAEIAALLSGNTTSGLPIPGLARRKASRSLADALGIAPGAIPGRAGMATLAAGRKADGTPIPEREAASVLRRLREALGVRRGRRPTPQEAENLAAGLSADGSPACGGKLLRRLHHRAGPVAYRDFTFAPDKSVSVAWAIGSEAERAIVEACHHRAVERTMAAIVDEVGHVRLGDGGRRGRVPGATIQLRFTHYTARATGADGARPGDMHLHTQVVLLNVARPAGGRPGRLDLGRMQGRTHEFGALYQAWIATELRRAGIAAVLDAERGCARVAVIPDAMVDLFSQRTKGGRASLERHLAATGATAAGLTHRRRVALMKQSVQGDPRGQRRDDVADEAFWREAAAACAPIARIGPPTSRTEAERLDEAVRCATLFLERTRLEGRNASAREAAARGLVAAGIEGLEDVDRVAAGLDMRGIGEAAPPAVAASPGDVIAAKRSDGTAILVEGGVDDVLAAAVSRRARLVGSGTSARIVVATPEEEIAATQSARRARSDEGLLAPASFSVATTAGPGGMERLELAVGDIVAFGRTVNRRGSRGRVAAAGTPVEIVAIDDDGLTVINAKGNEASISRTSLEEPGGAAVALRYGYAVTGRAPIAEAAVIAATAGSREVGSGPPPRTCDHLVFGKAIEAAAIPHGGEAGDDAIWNAIAANFAKPARAPERSPAERARRNAADVEHRGHLLIERAPPDAVATALARPAAAPAPPRIRALVDALAGRLARTVRGKAHATDERPRAPAASAEDAAVPAAVERPAVDVADRSAERRPEPHAGAPRDRILAQRPDASRSERRATPCPVPGSVAAARAAELASIGPSAVEAVAARLATGFRGDLLAAMGGRLSRLLAASRSPRTPAPARPDVGHGRRGPDHGANGRVAPAIARPGAGGRGAASRTERSETARPPRRPPDAGPAPAATGLLAALRETVARVASRAAGLAGIPDEAVSAYGALSRDASRQPAPAIVGTLHARLTRTLDGLAPRHRAAKRGGLARGAASEASIGSEPRRAMRLPARSDAAAPRAVGAFGAEGAAAHEGTHAAPRPLQRVADAPLRTASPPATPSAPRSAPEAPAEATGQARAREPRSAERAMDPTRNAVQPTRTRPARSDHPADSTGRTDADATDPGREDDRQGGPGRAEQLPASTPTPAAGRGSAGPAPPAGRRAARNGATMPASAPDSAPAAVPKGTAERTGREASTGGTGPATAPSRRPAATARRSSKRPPGRSDRGR